MKKVPQIPANMGIVIQIPFSDGMVIANVLNTGKPVFIGEIEIDRMREAHAKLIGACGDHTLVAHGAVYLHFEHDSQDISLHGLSYVVVTLDAVALSQAISDINERNRPKTPPAPLTA